VTGLRSGPDRPTADADLDGPDRGLRLDGVSVDYGTTRAVDDFSLAVDKGEIVAVLGPSGCGKSTLLRAVAGLEPLATGRIVLDGRDLDGVPTHRRGLGLMFQDHGLFTHLTVADNIGYGLKIAGQSRAEREARVGELLELIGLAGFERRRPGQLSGGEAQRVALARALAPKPGLLMLDEPLGSLDRALRDQLTGDLRRLLTDLGQTALHVTHDQSEAFAVADRVVVVSDGRLVGVGSPSELWDDPGTRFVAEFLGHPNIWSVSVADDGLVTWGRWPLGAVGPGHRLSGCGEHLVVMPTTGLRLDTPTPTTPGPTGSHPNPGPNAGSEPGRIDATVADTTFAQGRFDVVAATDTGQQLELSTDRRVDVGDRITVSVDVDAIRPLR
jgi:thiamine transport system ATP-binding protein